MNELGFMYGNYEIELTSIELLDQIGCSQILWYYTTNGLVDVEHIVAINLN